MQAILELTGPAHAGKTTICAIVGDELAPASLLFVDASYDQTLTRLLSVDAPKLTLGQLFSPEAEGTGNREALDWVFNDLTVPAGENNELLSVGPLPQELPVALQEKLRYGLSRLLPNYDYVLIDGWHPLIHAYLPPDILHCLHVSTPADFRQWTPLMTPGLAHTPTLLLNQYSGEAFPSALEAALQESQVQLIGKIPRYASQNECEQRMADDFRDCMLRLNIPRLAV